MGELEQENSKMSSSRIVPESNDLEKGKEGPEGVTPFDALVDGFREYNSGSDSDSDLEQDIEEEQETLLSSSTTGMSPDGKDEGATSSDKGFLVTLNIIGLTFIWWTTSSMFSVYSKRVFNAVKDAESEDAVNLTAAVVLTVVQLAGAAGLYLASLGFRELEDSFQALTKDSWKIGLFYFFGNLSTNLTLAFVSVTKTQTFKAAEPLFVVGALWVLQPQKCKAQVNLLAGLCLLTTVGGVAIGSYSPPFSFEALGFAFMSNCCFGFANVFVKITQDHSVFSMFDIYGACCVVGFIASLFVLCVVALGTGLETVVEAYDFVSIDSNGWRSATCYFLYNLFSFLVLGLVVSSTHAVLKVGKRIAALAFAGIFLRDQLTTRQWFGIWVALMGIILYGDCKPGSKLSVGVALYKLMTVTTLVVIGVFTSQLSEDSVMHYAEEGGHTLRRLVETFSAQP